MNRGSAFWKRTFMRVYRITEAPQISMNLRRIPMVEVTGLEPSKTVNLQENGIHRRI